MKKIEVYVKNEDIMISSPTPTKYGFSPLTSKWTNIPWEKLSNSSYKISLIPAEDERALEMAIKLAKQTGAELKAHYIHTLSDRVLARLKGIKLTPTIIIDGKKFEGLPEEKDLYSLISD